MSRASEISNGCSIPNLVPACHCGEDCPNVPTREGLAILRRARVGLEDQIELSAVELDRINVLLYGPPGSGKTYCAPRSLLPLNGAEENARLESASELLEDLERLECEVCTYCSEFTSRSCELCGGLAGERHALARIYPGETTPAVFYEGCTDCLLYVANGDLPED